MEVREREGIENNRLQKTLGRTGYLVVRKEQMLNPENDRLKKLIKK